MKSLSKRLLLVLLATVFLGWAIGFGCQVMQMTREQTGWWDTSLRGIGQQILLSTPTNIELYATDRRLKLPAATDVIGGKLSYQVWMNGRRMVMRSPDAPDTPLKPDFREGHADVVTGNDEWRVFAVTDSTGNVQVQVGKRYSQLAQDLWRWGQISLITASLILVALAAAMWVVIRWSLRPVTAVQAAIRTRHTLDLQPLPEAGLPDEVRPLVESFNRLLGRLDHAVQTERRFIADAAHELRTPLAALLAHAQLALHTAGDGESRETLRKLVLVVERSARLSEQLLDLARLDATPAAPDHQFVDVADLVIVVARDFEITAQGRGQSIALELSPCVVRGHVDELGMLIRNLLDNAVRYGRRGGRVIVRCGAGAADGTSGPTAVLEVVDDGPGVPLAERERMFDRFYRVPGTLERGSGIGLSLVRQVVGRHGARIEVRDGFEGRGLALRVSFNAAPPGATRASDEPRRAAWTFEPTAALVK